MAWRSIAPAKGEKASSKGTSRSASPGSTEEAATEDEKAKAGAKKSEVLHLVSP